MDSLEWGVSQSRTVSFSRIGYAMNSKHNKPRSAHGQVMRAAGVLGLMTVVSRVLGMIRDVVSAKSFGTTWQWDAFVYAFMLPNFFRRIIGEGALSSAFIPVYSETLHLQGKEQAFRFANKIGTLVAAGLAVFILGIELVLQVLLHWGIFPERIQLTFKLLQYFFPYLWLMSIYAFAMGILNSHQHFFSPSLSPVILDLVWIAGVIFVVPAVGGASETQLIALALVILFSGVLQVGEQLPELFKMGFRFRWIWDWLDQGVKKTGHLILPALMGFAIVQINILVDMSLGFLIGPGANSSLWYGTRLMQFPLGVFAVAMGTALLPTISEQTANQKLDEAKKTISFALRNIFLIILPCSVGLIILREPIVKLLFERGEFDALSTSRTAAVLLCYTIGLFAYSGQKIIVTGFYALQDTKTPVRLGVVALVTNIVLNVIFMGPMKEAGLALATSISGILQFILLMVYYHRKVSKFPFLEIGVSFAKMTVASLVMGIAGTFFYEGSRGIWPGDGVFHQMLQVFVPILLSIAVFCLLCVVLRLREMKEAIEWIMKRKKPGTAEIPAEA